MDQHPIPQDVTGFQFKLIGTMTVKQFGYVACGVIMAVVMYYLPLHFAFGVLIKVLFIPLFAGSGVMIAFVPIDGRPIDTMATNFAKALFSPNQYIYRRPGRKLSFAHITLTKPQTVDKGRLATDTTGSAANRRKNNQMDEKEAKLRAFLSSSQGGIKNDMDKKEAAFLKTLTLPTTSPVAGTFAPVAKPLAPVMQTAPVIKPFVPTPVQMAPIAQPAAQPIIPPAPKIVAAPVQPVAPTPVPTPTAAPIVQPTAATAPVPPQKKEEELIQKENQLTQELTKAQQEEAANPTAPLHDVAHQKVTVLSQQIQEIHAQKQQLEQELTQLRNQLATQKGVQPPPVQQPAPSVVAASVQTAPMQAAAPTQDPQHVRNIPQDVTKKAGLPRVSDTPNVVVGIVKDPRGNVLPNILVEVKDKEGNPVRAFKTNSLGQFASATPLSSGVYTMELEDPKKLHRFDVIQITANNQVLPAMEVISHDAREDLRKQLFAS